MSPSPSFIKPSNISFPMTEPIPLAYSNTPTNAIISFGFVKIERRFKSAFISFVSKKLMLPFLLQLISKFLSATSMPSALELFLKITAICSCGV